MDINYAGGDAITAADALLSILISDGDANADARAALLNPAYTKVGASITRESNSSNRTLVDIVLAQGYTNNPDVAVCQPVQNFGTGICEPTAFEIDLFNAINLLRTAPTTAHATELSAIIGSFSGNIATYDWNADTTATAKGFATGATKWTNAQTFLAGSSPKTAYKWQGGLYQAAKDHVADMNTQKEITIAGSDGSTPASRASKYGAGTVTETVYGDDFSAVTYALALVAEGGSYQNNIFSDTFTHLAVAQGAFQAPQNSVIDLIYTSNFVTASPYSECMATVVTAAPAPTTGAIANFAASVATLGLLAASLI